MKRSAGVARGPCAAALARGWSALRPSRGRRTPGRAARAGSRARPSRAGLASPPAWHRRSYRRSARSPLWRSCCCCKRVRRPALARPQVSTAGRRTRLLASALTGLRPHLLGDSAWMLRATLQIRTYRCNNIAHAQRWAVELVSSVRWWSILLFRVKA